MSAQLARGEAPHAPRGMAHATQGTQLADLLERVLDKGIVIAGDVKVKIVDIELLTIQLRLVVCSVDRAREMGMDWWNREPAFAGGPRHGSLEEGAAAGERSLEGAGADAHEVADLRRRLALLEERLAATA